MTQPRETQLFITRFTQHRVYDFAMSLNPEAPQASRPLLCVIDPFEQNLPHENGLLSAGLSLDEYFSELMGTIPFLLWHRDDGQDWHQSARERYGMPTPLMDVDLDGFVIRGAEEEGYKEPDLYPVAVFENPENGERVLFFPYAITCFTTARGELVAAVRFD